MIVGIVMTGSVQPGRQPNYTRRCTYEQGRCNRRPACVYTCAYVRYFACYNVISCQSVVSLIFIIPGPGVTYTVYIKALSRPGAIFIRPTALLMLLLRCRRI